MGIREARLVAYKTRDEREFDRMIAVIIKVESWLGAYGKSQKKVTESLNMRSQSKIHFVTRGYFRIVSSAEQVK